MILTSCEVTLMERRFAIVGHRAQSSGKINLNDLSGSSGRIDVLARAVNAGLFLSHGIRKDTHVTLHLLGGPGPVRRIWLEGPKLKGIHSDERAIAGQIGKALNEPVPAIGQFSELHSGFWHAGGGLNQTITEWNKKNVRIFVLDQDGDSIDSLNFDSRPLGFILSDDQTFTEDDLEAMKGLERISLGETWLQGHACIAIVQYLIDQN